MLKIFLRCSLALTRCFPNPDYLRHSSPHGPYYVQPTPHRSCLFRESLSLVSGWTATSLNPTHRLLSRLRTEKKSFYRFLLAASDDYLGHNRPHGPCVQATPHHSCLFHASLSLVIGHPDIQSFDGDAHLANQPDFVCKVSHIGILIKP